MAVVTQTVINHFVIWFACRLLEFPANPSCGLHDRNLGPGRKFGAMGRRRPISVCLLHFAGRVLRPQSRKRVGHRNADRSRLLCDLTQTAVQRRKIHDAIQTSDGLGYFFYGGSAI